MDLVAGALIGAAVNELLRAIKDARRRISSFEPTLKRLESTLVAITPRLLEITLLNQKLHHSTNHHHQSGGVADLIILARDGKDLVVKCSKISNLNYVRKVKYSKMLHDLDCNLLRYFDTVLQLDQLKDTKQILLVLNELHCKLFPHVNNDDKSREIEDEMRSLSNLGRRGIEGEIRSQEPKNELVDEITVKMEDEDQAEGSTSLERDYQGQNQVAVMELLDDLIKRLLAFRYTRPAKQMQLTEPEIHWLCRAARDIFVQQPSLLELEAPMKICGDIHGQYGDLLSLFEYGGFPPQSNYLFLGNYVNRGKQSLETICLLLCFKIKYPNKIFLLRGSQECAHINRTNGFYDQCKRRFNVSLWKVFNECFNCLPVAALIGHRILCMHGGLSPELTNLDQIRNLPRPYDVPKSGLLYDLIWSDPCRDVKSWGINNKGFSHTFGPNKVSEFLQNHDMDLICRAHQVVKDGYEFFADRQLVTIFSAPNYSAGYDHAGAMMIIDESLVRSFKIFRPRSRNLCNSSIHSF